MADLARVPFRSLAGAKEGYLRLRSSLRNIREKADKAVMGVARTGEVAVASAAAGGINGYFGNPQIGPVAVDLGLGGLLRLGGILMGEGAGEHVSALGDGMIGAFAYRKTERMAMEAAAEGAGLLLADGKTPDVLRLISNREAGLNDDGTPRANGGA